MTEWMYPIDKVNLDVLRFAHFLALAAVTVYFVKADWPGLKSPWFKPAILCGQHSLEIFCLGVFLAFAAHFVMVEIYGGSDDAGRRQHRRHPDYDCDGGLDFVVQGDRKSRWEAQAISGRRSRRRRGMKPVFAAVVAFAALLIGLLRRRRPIPAPCPAICCSATVRCSVFLLRCKRKKS